jgi:hypothetical protein
MAVMCTSFLQSAVKIASELWISSISHAIMRHWFIYRIDVVDE